MQPKGVRVLKIVVFFIAFLILTIVGFLPIILSRVMDSTKYEDVMGNDNVYLAIIILSEIYVILFTLLGLFGSVKPSRGCLIWYIVFLFQALVLFFIVFLAFLIFYISQDKFLTDYCKDGSFTPYRKQVRLYDDQIKNMGQSGYFCETSACSCNLPGSNAAFTVYIAEYNDANTPASGNSLTDSSSGSAKLQDCPFYQSYGGHMKAFLEAMAEIEAQSNCAGLCYRSNVAIASDSSNEEVEVNFNAGGGSCFQPFIDYATNLWMRGLIYFAVVLMLLLVQVVLSMCLLCQLNKMRRNEYKSKVADMSF